ncbi:DEAD/DEAH box helicase family protein [Kitasatospora sp. NPDC057223]|uniref:DEAD/DEAH box helicase family protein n=1 Tax=Kitasatospora sp. NPDC057223 TaxID=3346055 RepID=UPI0036374356
MVPEGRRRGRGAGGEVRGWATVVAATGSGKTLIAAGCARRLAVRGRVLVPTIELLEQTAEAGSLRGGRRGLAVAACSRQEALESAEAGCRVHARVTTQAARLADLVADEKAGEPVTVYATYASLERIVQAHKLHRLPAWDLVVIDEAHRTAGSEGKAWAAVHADDQVPAKRRLYFTATPRIADDRRAKDGLADLTDTDGEKLPALCSMSDETIYGKTCFTWTLGQGIEHGYLADYRVLVPVATDEDPRELLNLAAVADLRSQRSNEGLLRLALQIAVLRAVADLGLRRVITFHSRVSAAREFANTLLDACELLEDAERPERIWAKAVAGIDRLKDRRAAFTEFKAHTGEDGEECGILCNARLLSEGIDVRAVDAVCFADPKSSVIDIVQAVEAVLPAGQGLLGHHPGVPADAGGRRRHGGRGPGRGPRRGRGGEGGGRRRDRGVQLPHDLAGPAGAGGARRPGGRPDHRAARQPVPGHRAHHRGQDFREREREREHRARGGRVRSPPWRVSSACGRCSAPSIRSPNRTGPTTASTSSPTGAA